MKTPNQMIKTLIERHKMTQSEIGEAVGIHQSTVCRLYRGEAVNTTFEIGMKIVALYNKKQGK